MPRGLLSYAQPMTALQPEIAEGTLPFPAKIGRYQILAPIGTGGMATVYLARAQGFGGFVREVAVKLLHPHLGTDEGLVQQFITEGQIAAKIRHPNVVSVFDVGKDPFGLYLVLEYIEGDTLSGLVRAAAAEGITIPTAVLLRIVCDALAGLHVAHELSDDNGQPLGLIHRDFTPQNVLIGTDGVARLADFGVVKIMGVTRHTLSGVVKGKLGYMAPEQARGQRIDRRCDIWAAGVVTWELLAGKRLGRGKDEVAMLLDLVTRDPPSLREVRPDLPEDLVTAVTSALTRKLTDRCPHAETFRQRLIDAWKAQGGIADTSEVAHWVQRLSASKLAARKVKIQALCELREQMKSIVEADEGHFSTSADQWTEPSGMQLKSASARDPVQTGREDEGGEQSTVRLDAVEDALAPNEASRPAAKIRRSITVVAIAMSAVSMVAIIVFAAVRDRYRLQTPEAQSTTAQATSSSAPDGTRSEQERDTPLAARQLVVGFEANAPMRRLRIGDREIPIRTPSKQVSVVLTDGSLNDVEVEATAQDGRVARRNATLGEGSTVQISFAPALAKDPRRPGIRRKADTGRTPLAGNPYE